MATGATKAKTNEIALPTNLPQITGYEPDVRFYATRYKQGGRTVYALDLSLLQVEALVPTPDPKKPTPGNRAIRENHAIEFGKYLRKNPDWVAPSMILRAPNIFKFETLTEIEGTEFGIVSFGRLAQSDIHILDGQHRILGIHLAKVSIDEDIDRARSALATARKLGGADAIGAKEAKILIANFEKEREKMARERISIQIFVEEDASAYKQMFFDIADNALGITSSVKARFDSRKVVNRALDMVTDHPLLRGRVDPERDRVVRGSPFLYGAKHVAEIVRASIVGLEGRVSRRQEAELDEHAVAAVTMKFLDALVAAFPPLKAIEDDRILPEELRRTSLLGSVLMIRILGGAYYELVTVREWSQDDAIAYFKKLAPHMEAPVYEGSIWMEHTTEFHDGTNAPTGRRQDLAALLQHLVDWAILKPEWLDAPPAPRPSEVDEDYGIGYTAAGADIPSN